MTYMIILIIIITIIMIIWIMIIIDNNNQLHLSLSNVKSDDWSDLKNQLLTLERPQSHWMS